MAFDWVRFFEQHNIPYATRGANVGRGHVNCQCPWCGASDPSQHLSVDLQDRGYRCFRNPSHRGRSRARLIQALLRCSREHAEDLAGTSRPPLPHNQDVSTKVASLLGVSSGQQSRSEKLSFPSEFKSLSRRSVLAEPFWAYLRGRDYSDHQIKWLADTYNLQYAVRGPFRYRVIIPVYDSRGNLITWTGRSISPDAEIRYRTLPVSGEGLTALAPPGELLLGMPVLRDCVGAEALVVCEGPFDALRISAIGHEHGVYGTCLFGLNVSNAQSELLAQLSSQFPRIWVCLDDDARLVVLRILDRLALVNCRWAKLPDGVKDPGALSNNQASRFIKSLAA